MSARTGYDGFTEPSDVAVGETGPDTIVEIAGTAFAHTVPPKRARTFRTLLRNKKAVFGLVILVLIIGAALLAPWLLPGDPTNFVGLPDEAPSSAHWFGTTHQGQDVLAMTVWGSRVSLLVGFLTGILATAVGIIVGLASAYFGRMVDELLSLLTNVFLLLPGLPLLVILAAFLPPGPLTIVFVLAATGWAGSARVLRAQALSIRSKDFVNAATVTGERPVRIMIREILPNMLSVAMTTLLGCVIYGIGAQAGLEFLGLGDVSSVSWGTNLYWASNDGALMTGTWWTFVPSGACIALVAFALAMLNNAVDEMANPRLRPVKRSVRRAALKTPTMRTAS